MNQAFNPYLKWLGIPLKHQPPTHYRLLGVETFESDADIIERAADRQMTYLRSLQAGEHSRLAQQLLNEVASAKVCLLDADKKERYDQELRQRQQEQDLRPGIPPTIGQHTNGHAEAPLDLGMVAEAVIAAPAPSARPAPPPRRPPLAGSSGVGLKAADAMPQIVTIPAPIIQTAPKKSSVATAPSAAGAPPADGEGKSSTMVSVLIGLAAVAALVVAGSVLYLILSKPRQPENNIAQGTITDNSNGQSTGNQSTGNSGTNSGSTGTGSGTNQGTGGTKNGSNNSTTGGSNNTGTSGTNNSGESGTTTAGNTNPPRRSGALLAIEAPFLIGTMDDDWPSVLVDRDFTFESLDESLRGLEFTRWDFGPVQQFRFEVDRPGTVYMILPPDNYQRPIPEINVKGWTKTALSCLVRIDENTTLPCRVYSRDGSAGAAKVSAGKAIWPIIAAANIEKKARILGDVVTNAGNTGSGNTGNTGSSNTGSGNTGSGNTGSGNTGSGNTRPDEDPPPDKEEPAETVVLLQLPDSASQEPIKKKLEDLYGLAGLKTSEDRLSAAKNLLEVASQPSEKHVERYVMLSTGAQLAADAGDLVTALAAVDQIGGTFEADTTAMKLHLVRQFTKSGVTANIKAAQLEQVIGVIDEGLANDHFDEVDDVVTALMAARLRHPALAGRRKIALDMKDIYRKVSAAKKVLDSSPDDGAASSTVGQYYTFVKRDWEQGLPLLAKGEDADLKDAATRDLANPEAGPDQLSLADAWFKVAQLKKDSPQEMGALLVRAEEWYSKALSDIKGLDEAHARKRLDEIKQELSKMGWVDIPKKATIAAACGDGFEMYHNGQRIMSAYSYRVASATVTLKRGDVLLIKGAKSRSYSGTSTSNYYKGFACVIGFEGGGTPVATGRSKGWEAYAPSNTSEWYKPENVASIVPMVISGGAGFVDLTQQTGVEARSIWYAANVYDAYFLYRVP